MKIIKLPLSSSNIGLIKKKEHNPILLHTMGSYYKSRDMINLIAKLHKDKELVIYGPISSLEIMPDHKGHEIVEFWEHKVYSNIIPVMPETLGYFIKYHNLKANSKVRKSTTAIIFDGVDQDKFSLKFPAKSKIITIPEELNRWEQIKVIAEASLTYTKCIVFSNRNLNLKIQRTEIWTKV